MKHIVKMIIGSFIYKIAPPQVNVLSIVDTLKKIKENKCSIGRFGDGEMEIIFKSTSYNFQSRDEKLVKELKDVLYSKKEDFLVGLPDFLHSTENYNYKFKYFWLYHYARNMGNYRSLAGGRVFSNAHVSRPYFGRMSDAGRFKEIANLWKEIFAKRDILIVEGEYTKFGRDNDLLDGAGNISRILCPQHNAYNVKQEIIEVVNKQAQEDTLIIFALGPTATVLAKYFCDNGKQAIDIGSLDIEYSLVYDRKNVVETSDGYFRVKNKFNHGVDNSQEYYETNESFYDDVVAQIRPRN